MQSLFTAEELELSYPIIHGVVSSSHPVTLGFVLSQHPDFDVELYDDVVNYSKDSLHVAYRIKYLEDDTKCLLIKNKGTKELLYKKYKQVDYLICAMNEEEINTEIIEIIRKLSGIMICFALDNPNQKEILNFMQLQ
ncbi:MAG: hypothetical protein COA58_05015 [Bacteroidetes bacterium]|nr:MAG: hypothetical protein COA58_05015 [Bacteroidota bacterium]